MRRTRSFTSITALVVMLAAPSLAQTPAPSQPQAAAPTTVGRPMDPARLRRAIYIIEGALARAVAFGAQDLNRKIRSAMPDVMALSGEPQARGVYLEGYGVYFDVAVPVLNQVMITSIGRMLGPDEAIVAALTQLKSYIQAEKNPAQRASLEMMLSRLELQLGPSGSERSAGAELFTSPGRPSPGASSAAMVSQNPPAAMVPVPSAAAPNAIAEPKFDRRSLQDPNTINRVYTESVQNALIETIIDHVGPLVIKPEEFLTIAARDNMQRDTLAPWDPYEEVVTILLRFKGSDLAAYRAGQIDAVELRKRIEIREF
jgi:hypothetical protein